MNWTEVLKTGLKIRMDEIILAKMYRIENEFIE